ncbi:hypothetical protein [Gryllotalpicola koreensis]|uniref:Uncharacterized protein n=1 Tax=Gryllotalpicola koreensis TaxID=993086 RepID=A0ABP8A1M5_9MICO
MASAPLADGRTIVGLVANQVDSPLVAVELIAQLDDGSELFVASVYRSEVLADFSVTVGGQTFTLTPQ